MYTDVVTIGEFDDLLPANTVWHDYPRPTGLLTPTSPAAESAPMIASPVSDSVSSADLPFAMREKGLGDEGFPITLTDEDAWSDESAACQSIVSSAFTAIIITDPDDDDSDQRHDIPAASITTLPDLQPTPATSHEEAQPIIELPHLRPTPTSLAQSDNICHENNLGIRSERRHRVLSPFSGLLVLVADGFQPSAYVADGLARPRIISTTMSDASYLTHAPTKHPSPSHSSQHASRLQVLRPEGEGSSLRLSSSLSTKHSGLSTASLSTSSLSTQHLALST